MTILGDISNRHQIRFYFWRSILSLLVLGWYTNVCFSPGLQPCLSVSEGVKIIMPWWCNLILIRGPQPNTWVANLPWWSPSQLAVKFIIVSFLIYQANGAFQDYYCLMYLHLETKTSFLSDDMEQISRWKIMLWLSGRICIFKFREKNLILVVWNETKGFHVKSCIL